MKQSGHMLLLIFFVPLMIATFASSSFSEVGIFWKIWAGLGVVLMAWLGSKYEKNAEENFQKAQSEYEKTYMCLRCGHFYKPFD